MKTVKKMSLFVVVTLALAVSSFSFAQAAADTEAPRCHGYCIKSFLQQTGMFYYFDAQRCNGCADVTLKCGEDHFMDGSLCSNCTGSCPGHDLTDCSEVAELPPANP